MVTPRKLSPEELEAVIPDDMSESDGVALCGHIAALESENANFKPSGQVAEDVEIVVRTLCAADEDLVPTLAPARDALARLAAKAQGYEAALADNAALVVLRFAAEPYRLRAHNLLVSKGPGWKAKEPQARALLDACGSFDSSPHPGAALLEEHRKTLEPLKAVVVGLAEEMEAAIRERERPKGGQSVPFHGDFAQAPPSMVSRLRWWAREMREALAGRTSALLVRAKNEGLEKAAQRCTEACPGVAQDECPCDACTLARRIRDLKEPESL